LVKHPNYRRLIAAASCQKATKLLPALILGGDTLSSFEILRPPLCSYRCGQVGKLLRLQTKELIPGLTGLQRAGRALA
jgi:hypothetical protein